MSFQAYLDAVETKTGFTPRQLVDLAREKGFDESTKGPQISAKHVGSGGAHADASDTLWIDGKDSNPHK